MFQYMMAVALQERVPSAAVVGARMPVWGLDGRDLDEPRPNRLYVGFRRNRIPLDAILELVAHEPCIDLLVEGVNLRLEYWHHLRERFCELFAAHAGVRGGGPHELVINVRAADILDGVHSHYIPTPIGLHAELIDRLRLEPVFVGQLAPSAYSDALRSRFPDARFIDHGTPLGDFEFIRASVNVVPAVSTYSWLAAWLSEIVERIYLPVIGLYDRRRRADIDLLPEDDPRYVLLRGELPEWTAAPEELDRIVSAPAAAFGFDLDVAGLPR
jgi:hypothetical protein